MTRRKLVGSFLVEDQEFQQLQAEDARREATSQGFDFEAVFADGRSLTQIRQLFSFINAPADDRPTAIVVEPATSEGYEQVARHAAREGIGWVLINARVQYIEILRREYPDLPISAVMTDQKRTGSIQAEQFKALMPNGGALLYVQGPSMANAARDRLHGMKDGIRGTDITVMPVTADWTEAGGKKAVLDWVRIKLGIGRSPRDITIDAVGCQNDALAVGARQALQEFRTDWAELPFTGCDGLPNSGQRLVRTGDLAATVVTPSNTGPAVRLIAAFLDQGQQIPPLEVLEPTSYPPIERLAARRR